MTYILTAAERVVKIAEHLTQVRNVRGGVKLQRACVGKELGELTGAALAQLCDGHLLLLLQDQAILVLRLVALETLPGQLSADKID